MATVERRIKVPLRDLNYTVGTWTLTLASNLLTADKTAADNTSVIHIPFPIDYATSTDVDGANSSWRVKSLEVKMTNGTADLDAAPTLTINKVTHVAASIDTAAAVTTSTTGNAVGRVSQVLTTTVTTPEWVQNGVGYNAVLTINAGATSAVKIERVEWVLDKIF